MNSKYLLVLTNHETIVKETIVGQMRKTAHLLPKHHTSNNSSPRAPQAATQRNGVLDVDMRLDGEGALVVASQHVERHAGDEVVLRVEVDVAGALALALVRDAAVERLVGRGALGAVDGDMQLEVDGEGEADDVETGADVGARARGLDDKGVHLWGGCLLEAIPFVGGR